jgi:hypothetical protein
MSSEKLSKILKFQIGNQYGIITWNEPTDINYLNFDNIVEITEMGIELYDEKKIGLWFKPEVIRLYQYFYF